jgi:glucosyl-dolichyl phosphate glucuronosyltransferase
MRLTVAICTRNRAAQLQQTLEQVTRLRTPSRVRWELLVIDNGSRDDTGRVLDAFATRLPIRPIFEPHPGKAYALNRAAQEAAGDYILWTDDDVLVDPDWLAAYSEAFQRWPEAAVFGGPISPRFVGTPPAWLQRAATRLQGVYARREIDTTPAPVTPEMLPFGANLAIRTREQLLHPYDTRLGPQPDSAIVHEEVVCLLSILASGATGWWVPGAKVQHCISPERQTIRYLRRFYHGQGEFVARIRPDHTSPTLFGRPRWLWRQAVTAEVRYRLHRWVRPPEDWVQDLVRASVLTGQLRAHGLPSLELPFLPKV